MASEAAERLLHSFNKLVRETESRKIYATEIVKEKEETKELVNKENLFKEWKPIEEIKKKLQTQSIDSRNSYFNNRNNNSNHYHNNRNNNPRGQNYYDRNQNSNQMNQKPKIQPPSDIDLKATCYLYPKDKHSNERCFDQHPEQWKLVWERKKEYRR